MVRAFKLYTGADNASHVLEGTIDEKDRTDVVAIHFKETPAHSSYDWHPDPEPQFVITLSGTLEFATPDGETFVVRPGDVLLAEDHIGKGHKWRLIDDQPWRRAYVVLKPGAKDSFLPKKDNPRCARFYNAGTFTCRTTGPTAHVWMTGSGTQFNANKTQPQKLSK